MNKNKFVTRIITIINNPYNNNDNTNNILIILRTLIR